MNHKLRVTFVMVRTGEWPSGGNRILYEHANYLARRGHIVTVVAPGRFVINPFWTTRRMRFAMSCGSWTGATRPTPGSKWIPGSASCACHLSPNALFLTEML